MANNTASNPKFFDNTTAATISGDFGLRLLQWIDDNADIPDNGVLVFSINGITLTATVQRNTTAPDFGAVVWQIGPFNPAMPCHDFSLTTMDYGHLHIWVT